MGAKVTVIDLKDYPMPFYDADVEASVGMPEHAKRFRNAMIHSDAILIASPEYNQSIFKHELQEEIKAVFQSVKIP